MYLSLSIYIYIYIYVYVWRWDIKYPRFVKALHKSHEGKHSSYDRTSFRLPIGSGREFITTFDQFLEWFCVPRLFGIFQNLHNHQI